MPSLYSTNKRGTMKKKKLYIVAVPPVSHDFAHELSRRFPPMEVKPGISQDDLQYNAGQRSVIDFVLKSSTGTTISGNADDLRPDPRGKSLLDKLLGVIR